MESWPVVLLVWTYALARTRSGGERGGVAGAVVVAFGLALGIGCLRSAGEYACTQGGERSVPTSPTYGATVTRA